MRVIYFFFLKILQLCLTARLAHSVEVNSVKEIPKHYQLFLFSLGHSYYLLLLDRIVLA